MSEKQFRAAFPFAPLLYFFRTAKPLSTNGLRYWPGNQTKVLSPAGLTVGQHTAQLLPAMPLAHLRRVVPL